MKFEHTFLMPLGVDAAFAVLCDLERVGPCLPGATVTSVEDGCAQGTVAVKLGAMKLTYEGTAKLVDISEERHRARMLANARQVGGNSTVAAEFTMVLVEEGKGRTRVTVTTEVDVTGRPAQMGRSLISSVGERLVDQFAAALSGQLSEHEGKASPSSPEGEEAGKSEDFVDAPRSPAAASSAHAAGEPLDVGSLLAGTVWGSLRAKQVSFIVLAVIGIVGLDLIRRRFRRTGRRQIP